MTELKMPLKVLKQVKQRWLEYKRKAQNKEKIEFGACEACGWVKQQVKMDWLHHAECLRFCPFHGEICCDSPREHDVKPIYFLARDTLPSNSPDVGKFCKYADRIISAVDVEIAKAKENGKS